MHSISVACKACSLRLSLGRWRQIRSARSNHLRRWPGALFQGLPLASDAPDHPDQHAALPAPHPPHPLELARVGVAAGPPAQSWRFALTCTPLAVAGSLCHKTMAMQ